MSVPTSAERTFCLPLSVLLALAMGGHLSRFYGWRLYSLTPAGANYVIRNLITIKTMQTRCRPRCPGPQPAAHDGSEQPGGTDEPRHLTRPSVPERLRQRIRQRSLPGALPVGQNSPQKAPYGLYAELLSGTAFTMARSELRRTWLYRIRPSALHPRFERLARQPLAGPLGAITPNRLRWSPQPIPPNPPTSSKAGCRWWPTRRRKNRPA
jgi:hypothetical protein